MKKTQFVQKQRPEYESAILNAGRKGNENNILCCNVRPQHKSIPANILQNVSCESHITHVNGRKNVHDKANCCDGKYVHQKRDQTIVLPAFLNNFKHSKQRSSNFEFSAEETKEACPKLIVEKINSPVRDYVESLSDTSSVNIKAVSQKICPKSKKNTQRKLNKCQNPNLKKKSNLSMRFSSNHSTKTSSLKINGYPFEKFQYSLDDIVLKKCEKKCQMENTMMRPVTFAGGGDSVCNNKDGLLRFQQDFKISSCPPAKPTFDFKHKSLLATDMQDTANKETLKNKIGGENILPTKSESSSFQSLRLQDSSDIEYPKLLQYYLMPSHNIATDGPGTFRSVYETMYLQSPIRKSMGNSVQDKLYNKIPDDELVLKPLPRRKEISEKQHGMNNGIKDINNSKSPTTQSDFCKDPSTSTGHHFIKNNNTNLMKTKIVDTLRKCNEGEGIEKETNDPIINITVMVNNGMTGERNDGKYFQRIQGRGKVHVGTADRCHQYENKVNRNIENRSPFKARCFKEQQDKTTFMQDLNCSLTDMHIGGTLHKGYLYREQREIYDKFLSSKSGLTSFNGNRLSTKNSQNLYGRFQCSDEQSRLKLIRQNELLHLKRGLFVENDYKAADFDGPQSSSTYNDIRLDTRFFNVLRSIAESNRDITENPDKSCFAPKNNSIVEERESGKMLNNEMNCKITTSVQTEWSYANQNNNSVLSQTEIDMEQMKVLERLLPKNRHIRKLSGKQSNESNSKKLYEDKKNGIGLKKPRSLAIKMKKPAGGFKFSGLPISVMKDLDEAVTGVPQNCLSLGNKSTESNNIKISTHRSLLSAEKEKDRVLQNKFVFCSKIDTCPEAHKYNEKCLYLKGDESDFSTTSDLNSNSSSTKLASKTKGK